MVSIEKTGYAELVKEARETGAASQHYRGVLQRAHEMEEECGVTLNTHVVAGHPAQSMAALCHIEILGVFSGLLNIDDAELV